MTGGARAARWSWRSLGAPLPIAAWISLFLIFLAVRAVAHALRSAELVRLESVSEHARLAAETAAMQVDATAVPGTALRLSFGDTSVTAQRGGSGWTFAASLADGSTWRFRAPMLPGGAPAAFAEPLVATDPAVLAAIGGGRSCRSEDLPKLDAAAIAAVPRLDRWRGFRRDVGIALLHWEAGTEADDFVLDGNVVGADDRGLVVVPGHLWIGEAATPLRLELEHDLVVVVQGNLYIGRSIETTGRGRLLFAPCGRDGALPFADLDGNGRWSAGDRLRTEGAFRGVAEGGGNVYLGLAGSTAELRLAVGLVPCGELHVATDVAIDGPLVVPHGVTTLGSRPCRLRVTGRRLYRVGRELVAGFLPEGVPRIGLLRPVGADPGALPEVPLDEPQPDR